MANSRTEKGREVEEEEKEKEEEGKVHAPKQGKFWESLESASFSFSLWDRNGQASARQQKDNRKDGGSDEDAAGSAGQRI